MEDTNQPLDAGVNSGASGPRLQFTGTVRSDLQETAKWALFFAVLLFVVIGLLAVAAVYSLVEIGPTKILPIFFFLAVYGLLIYYPAWYYYKFSTLTRQALNFDDNDALDEGFLYLRRFYRFVGILILVVIGIYILIAVASVVFMSGSRY